MRSHPADYEMVSPGTLEGVLRLLHDKPGHWTPVAGATEVMVQFSAGKLPGRQFINIWNIPELRTVREEADTLVLGGGCSFSQIRNWEPMRRHFPLLAQGASWTGGIANQNRATIAGNLANASPAADSAPVLLAYDAELELVSAGGTRRIPCGDFHLGYKRTALYPTELILAIHLKKRYDGYFSYGRKTGARDAQAISKVCIAGLGRMCAGRIEDVRIGIGAVAPVPVRLRAVEETLLGRRVDAGSIAEARRALDANIAPIDDIRSVAEYRRFVAGNLVEEFLRELAASGETLSPALARWNVAPEAEAEGEVLPCCGSQRWARELAGRRPLASDAELFAASNEIWLGLAQGDWEEAFRSHPRIGERKPPPAAAPQSAAWSREEQKGIDFRNEEVMAELEQGNGEYEARFDRVFLICATGKSAAEMLETLRLRLKNDYAAELREAVEQQRQIIQVRLRKWVGQ